MWRHNLVPAGGISPDLAVFRRNWLAIFQGTGGAPGSTYLGVFEREADAGRVAMEGWEARDNGGWKRFHKKLLADRANIWQKKV